MRKTVKQGEKAAIVTLSQAGNSQLGGNGAVAHNLSPFSPVQPAGCIRRPGAFITAPWPPGQPLSVPVMLLF